MPLGSKKTQKNKVGKPRKFKTKDLLLDKINKYFAYCDRNTENKIDKEGVFKKVSRPIPYTIIGMCDFLEIHRDTFNEWIRHDKTYGYTDILKKARQKIEKNTLEGAMMGRWKESFSMFILKTHYGYKDNHNINIGGQSQNPVVVDFSKIKE